MFLCIADPDVGARGVDVLLALFCQAKTESVSLAHIISGTSQRTSLKLNHPSSHGKLCKMVSRSVNTNSTRPHNTPLQARRNPNPTDPFCRTSSQPAPIDTYCAHLTTQPSSPAATLQCLLTRSKPRYSQPTATLSSPFYASVYKESWKKPAE